MLYLPFHVLQILAQYQLLLRCSHRRAKHTVSADLTLLSWLWSSSCMVATALYAYSSVVRTEYTQRYPLYAEMWVSRELPFVHASQFLLSCLSFRRVFFDPQRRERLSIVCVLLVSVYGFVVAYFGWLCWAGRARINLLDIADVLYLVGTVSWAVRLIPQVSVDWFHECVPQMSFVYMQAASLAYAGVCNRMLEVPWHDQPVDKPTDASLALALGCCVCMQYQAYIYRSRLPS